MPELLRVENVTAGYGDGIVLDDVSVSIDEGDSLAVLGRNGMGKTTLLVTLMGFTRLRGGKILWRGQDIVAMPSYARSRSGLGWVPQERFMFPSLTVHEHLTAVARPGRWTSERVYELFPRLEERRGNYGNQLSGGEQQMLAIARALMTNPALLMLDEPLEGLAPIIIEAIAEAFKRLVSERSLAIVLVEQHTEIALALTQDALLIERGRVAHRARSSELARDAATLERLIGLKVH